MDDIQCLEEKARIVRRHIIKMIGDAGSGHPGGSLSCVEIAIALYYRVMRINPRDPRGLERDRFILSKGHASALLYAILAEKGYFPVEQLATFRKPWSNLAGHPDMNRVPGVDMTTGSLGQGLSVAIGMALAAKHDHRDSRTYVLLGDGEVQEGQIWEAAMAAAHFKLDNLTAFIDHNGLQIDGPTSEIMDLHPLDEKWRSFGWHVISIDGHDYSQILASVEEAGRVKRKPTMIIADTIKGKGVSFMEGKVEWHGKPPSGELYKIAKAELGCD
jgi:transketolase